MIHGTIGFTRPDQLTWFNNDFYNRGMENNGTVGKTFDLTFIKLSSRSIGYNISLLSLDELSV